MHTLHNGDIKCLLQFLSIPYSVYARYCITIKCKYIDLNLNNKYILFFYLLNNEAFFSNCTKIGHNRD